jgi:hypothetical protein
MYSECNYEGKKQLYCVNKTSKHLPKVDWCVKSIKVPAGWKISNGDKEYTGDVPCISNS